MTALNDSQYAAPYSEQLQVLASLQMERLFVPGHGADDEGSAHLKRVFGEKAVSLDFPMILTEFPLADPQVPLGDAPDTMHRALMLAADAWGASRAWFLTNGASAGNQIAMLALGTLGDKLIVQRSCHSSTIDGMMLANVEPVFLRPSMDLRLSLARGVTPQQVAAALVEHPDAAAVFVVSPSYSGAVADIAAIAKVAHDAGKPLIVDEAWGSHFGFHPALPNNAIRLGADLVISSTHKLAGSLTQSAMLLLGHGPHAAALGAAVDRVSKVVTSTSSSALLMAALDETRRFLATKASTEFNRGLESAEQLRGQIAEHGRFVEAREQQLAADDTIAIDPFKVVIDTRAGNIGGFETYEHLAYEQRVVPELATDGAVVFVLGAARRLDVDRVMHALDVLPEMPSNAIAARVVDPGPRAMSLRDAFFAPSEVVLAKDAVGRVSSDSLAAYPPGVPNLTPGETITDEIVDYLQAVAAAPMGYVRGAVDPAAATFRVVK